jgi:hypothetical protein
MRYVFKPGTKSAARQYDGLTLTKTSVRIAKQAAQRFAGLDHVRLAYDATATAICLRPVTGKHHQASPSVYKLSKGESASLEIACASLGRVMPLGR